MRRAKNKSRKSGLATRAHLLMRVSTHTLFNFPSCLPKDDCYDDCYDPVDSLQIPLFDDACCQDANMNYAYGYELAIVPYVKHEIIAIAPTLDAP